tara:strand:- start:49 stop:330 length:282 start_codon:yes stop_codon:yes gene_type:complete
VVEKEKKEMNRKQGEFDFMKNGITMGELIINQQNLRQGTVADWASDDDGNIEHVEILYEDGIKDWIPYGVVSKLLLETDPKPNTNVLNEDWSV